MLAFIHGLSCFFAQFAIHAALAASSVTPDAAEAHGFCCFLAKCAIHAALAASADSRGADASATRPISESTTRGAMLAFIHGLSCFFAQFAIHAALAASSVTPDAAEAHGFCCFLASCAIHAAFASSSRDNASHASLSPFRH